MKKTKQIFEIVQQFEACDLTDSPFPGPFRGKTSDW